ncbi:MAG: hypothetical protein HC905_12040, partial [Bacteroidales bacterium]|nr:hypothetical protein [Bacteroidales bacterium]
SKRGGVPPIQQWKVLHPIRHQYLFFSRNLSDRKCFSLLKDHDWGIHFLLVRSLLSHLNKNSKSLNIGDYDILYFYWGLRWSQVLPFCEFKRDNIIVRFHGSDLYNERNNHYIPFRKEQLQKISLSVFISNMGQQYLESRYGEYLKRKLIARLGTKDEGLAIYEPEGYKHIVTCSNMVELKQIDLLAQALKYSDFRIKWTHIGDGPLRTKIIKLIKEAGENITYSFPGYMDHPSLFAFIKTTQ